MSEPTDQQLVDAANRGDHRAFETLYLRYRDWVVGLAWRITGDRELTLEVLQETFLYLLGKFPGFELTAQMKTFLYPAVRHTAIALQSRGRRMRVVGELPDEPCAVESNNRSDELTTAIGRLPAAQREVLMLRYADDLSMEEIALALEIPAGTVKSRLHNAVAALRELLPDR